MVELEKVLHIGHELSEITYNSMPSDKGEGYFEVNMASDVNTILIRDDITDENNAVIFSYPAKVDVIGYEGEEGGTENRTEVFSLTFIIESLFSYPEEGANYKEIVESNRWFFDNLSFVNVANVAEDILKHTPYRSVRLSKSRK
ncbi:hypothetical protein [Aeromonas hydrophila]|uniref:hypothetical protein n=1 Tax=Aeromonas hydrophila TaxID=644 RepID=UPI002B4A98C2|nr:hypothetical protein [Aeromonas hydrophila]